MYDTTELTYENSKKIKDDLMNEGYDATHCSPDCWCKKIKNTK